MKKIFPILSLLILTSGCISSMGQRGLEAACDSDGCEMSYRSGSDLDGGFKGTAVMTHENGKSVVMFSGSGGSSDPSVGHKQTVKSIERAGNAAAEIGKRAIEGAFIKKFPGLGGE